MNTEYTPKVRWTELQSIIVDQEQLAQSANLCNQMISNINGTNSAELFKKRLTSVITYRCRAEMLTKRWIEWDKKVSQLVNHDTIEDKQYMNLLEQSKSFTDKNIAQSYKTTRELKERNQ